MAVVESVLTNLIRPGPLPSLLTPASVDKLSGTYPTSVAARADDIFALARLFTISLTAGTVADQAQRWHHLLMAAGNFKRQSGSIRIGPLIQAPDTPPPPPFIPPEGTVPLTATSGHEYFQTINGLRRAPTASVVLAALWPDENLIADRRDLNAAIGLLLPSADGMGSAIDGNLRAWYGHRRRVGILPSDFEWLKAVAVKTLGQPEFSGVSMLKLERALFMLDKRTKRLPWHEYGVELTQQATLCPGCHVLRGTAHATGCTVARGAISVW